MARFELTMGDISTDIKQYNKAYIDDFSCTSQISTDASSVNYGVIPASGSATMRDINDTIKTDIESGAIQYSGQKTNVYLNDGKIQELTTDDSTYNVIDKTLNIDFTNRLSVLDSVTYGGMPLRDYSMTAYDMLDDVIGSYGEYIKTRVTNWVKYFNADQFKILTNNVIKCATTSDGWEIIGTPIKVVPNKQYDLYYSFYIVGSSYTTAIPMQILSEPPVEGSAIEYLEIARVLLPTGIGQYASGTVSFTPTTDTIYLVLNFGYADDDQQIWIQVDGLGLNGKSLAKSTKNFAYKQNDVGYPTGANIGLLLQDIVIEHPYLEQASYRATIEKFCTLAQLTASLDDEGNFVFFDARPLLHFASAEKTLTIPRHYQISNLNKTLFVKNKFEGVDIKQYKFVGDTTEYSFEEVDLSTSGVESATNVVSISSNELMQNENDVIRVRDNIINDYRDGIPTATVDLFCGAKSGYENGEIVQPNDVLQFQDDDGVWRVTSRTFKYKGAPTLSLELQKQRYYDMINLDDVIVDDIFDDTYVRGTTIAEGEIASPYNIDAEKNSIYIEATITAVGILNGTATTTTTTIQTNSWASDYLRDIGGISYGPTYWFRYYGDRFAWSVSKKCQTLGGDTKIAYIKSIKFNKLIVMR